VGFLAAALEKRLTDPIFAAARPWTFIWTFFVCSKNSKSVTKFVRNGRPAYAFSSSNMRAENHAYFQHFQHMVLKMSNVTESSSRIVAQKRLFVTDCSFSARGLKNVQCD
jgi:hypothetical protein